MSDLGAVVAAYINNLHDMDQRAANFGYNLDLQRQADEAAMSRTIANAMAELQRQQATSRATAQNSFLQAILGGNIDPSTASMVLRAMAERGDISPEYVQPLQEAIGSQLEASRQRASLIANTVGAVYAAKGTPLSEEGKKNLEAVLPLMPPSEQAKMLRAFATQTGTTVNVGTGENYINKATSSFGETLGRQQAKQFSDELSHYADLLNQFPGSVETLANANIDLNKLREFGERVKGYRGSELLNKGLVTFGLTNDEELSYGDILSGAMDALGYSRMAEVTKGAITEREMNAFINFQRGQFRTPEDFVHAVLTAQGMARKVYALSNKANEMQSLINQQLSPNISKDEFADLQSQIDQKKKEFYELKRKPIADFLAPEAAKVLRNFYRTGRIENQETESGQQSFVSQTQEQPETGRKGIINEDNFQSHSKEFILGVTGAKDVGEAKKMFFSSMPEVITTNNKYVQEIIGGDRVNLKDFMLSDEIPDERKVRLLATILKNLHNQKVPTDKRKPYTSADYEALADYWLSFLIASYSKQHGK